MKDNRNTPVVENTESEAAKTELTARFKQFLIEKLRGGSADVNQSRTLDAASGANRIYTSPSDSAPSKSQKFTQTNRNLQVGSQDLATMGKTQTNEEIAKAQRVAARALCARNCKVQGNTSCKYCGGLGFATKSQQEGDPSHYPNCRSPNHSYYLLPTPRTSSKV